MSKELVINATSHERRVAILEEGQLVEIYIEREKEFALVGSIYKGKVTRVLPGMQSAFVDIGLDGDAFLYVSDVFENLEGYDHGHDDHGHEHAPAPVEAGAHVQSKFSRANPSAARRTADHRLRRAKTATPIRKIRRFALTSKKSTPAAKTRFLVLQNTLNSSTTNASPIRTNRRRRISLRSTTRLNTIPPLASTTVRIRAGVAEAAISVAVETGAAIVAAEAVGAAEADAAEGGSWPSRSTGRQKSSSFEIRCSARRRARQSRQLRKSWSTAAGYDKRGPRRDFNNRPESARSGQPGAPSGPSAPVEEEAFLLPGRIARKIPQSAGGRCAHRSGRGTASRRTATRTSRRNTAPWRESFARYGSLARAVPAVLLPSWLLAGGGPESTEVVSESRDAAAEAEEIAELDDEELDALEEAQARAEESENGAELSDDERSTLSSSLIDAKQDEIREEAHADSAAGGAVFEEDEAEGRRRGRTRKTRRQRRHENEEHEEEETHEPSVQEIVSAPQAIAEAEADAAHENALHIAALGDHVELEHHEHSTKSTTTVTTKSSTITNDEHEDEPRKRARPRTRIATSRNFCGWRWRRHNSPPGRNTRSAQRPAR